MSHHDESQWSPNDAEREALSHWMAPEPPSGMAARIAGEHVRRRSRRRWVLGTGLALAAGLLAVGAWVAWGPSGASGEPIPVAVKQGANSSLSVSVRGASLPAGVDVVVANLIASGLAEDEAEGWAVYAAQLHSDENYPRALASWRRFNYAALRRKVKLYVGEAAKPSIRVEDTAAGDRGTLTIKVFNRGNPDLPTPCHLRKDPKANGAWRVVRCSL